jgi:hypothetical protein
MMLTIGRFTGVDPIGEDFAWATVFNYAENEPIGHIDLWGLQAFFVHGTLQGKSGNSFSKGAKDELERITNNTARDESFTWYAPLLNNQILRTNASTKLADEIVQVRQKMINEGIISKNEGIPRCP